MGWLKVFSAAIHTVHPALPSAHRMPNAVASLLMPAVWKFPLALVMLAHRIFLTCARVFHAVWFIPRLAAVNHWTTFMLIRRNSVKKETSNRVTHAAFPFSAVVTPIVECPPHAA